MLVETTGDRRQDVPLHVIGGQGVFVKEVQQAVLDGRADVAVHSAKDLPSIAHDGAGDRRVHRAGATAADALVGRSLDELADGRDGRHRLGAPAGPARRGAAGPAVRRAARQHRHPPRAVPDGGAIVMAVAALEVLGLTDRIAERLDPSSGSCRPSARAASPSSAGVDDAATADAARRRRRRRDAPRRRGRAQLPRRARRRVLAARRRPRRRARRCTCSSPATTARRPRRASTCALDDGDHERGPRGGRRTPAVVGGDAAAGMRSPSPGPTPGELGDRLAALGATVVHVPLIEIADAADGGAALRAALARLDVVRLARRHVGQRRRARRCRRRRRIPALRLAAVGPATAAALADGRRAARRPRAGASPRPRGCSPSSRRRPPACSLAQADRARRVLADGLAAAGHAVESVAAYRTVVRTPGRRRGRRGCATVDAVVLASGSAAAGWAEAIGAATPPVVVAIGPVTADAARRGGLDVAHVADVARRRRRSSTLAGPSPTMTAMPGAPFPDRPARAGCAARRPCVTSSPRRRCARATSSPRCSSARASTEPQPIVVAARRRPAQPREPAQGGRRARRRSASAPSCCSACRRARTPSAAAPSTPTASCSSPSPTCAATSATTSC